MAGDTRDAGKSPAAGGSSSPPKPPENANLLADRAAINTAGGGRTDISFTEAVKTIRPEDFLTMHQKPCVRDGLLTGMGAGFGAGGLAAVLGKPIFKACNWAVGTFCFGAFAAYQYCLIQRQVEKDGMRKAVEIMSEKKSEKRQKMEEARAARRKAKEEADRLEEERMKKEKSARWYKFW